MRHKTTGQTQLSKLMYIYIYTYITCSGLSQTHLCVFSLEVLGVRLKLGWCSQLQKTTRNSAYSQFLEICIYICITMRCCGTFVQQNDHTGINIGYTFNRIYTYMYIYIIAYISIYIHIYISHYITMKYPHENALR